MALILVVIVSVAASIMDVDVSVPERGFVALIRLVSRLDTEAAAALGSVSVPERGFVALIPYRADHETMPRDCMAFQSPSGDSWL